MGACSILYKTRLPLVLTFNKSDVLTHEFAISWIQDFEKFHEALAKEETYAASLSQSLSIVLNEFYQNIEHIGLSALKGLNIDGFFTTISIARKDYLEHYLFDLEVLKAHKNSLKRNKSGHCVMSD